MAPVSGTNGSRTSTHSLRSLFPPTWRCSPLYCLLPHRCPSHGGPWQLQAHILHVEGSQEREKETALVPKVLAKVPMPMIFIIAFIYLGCTGLLAVSRFSLVASSGGYSLLRFAGVSSLWLLLWSTGSRHTDFSSCRTRAQ